MSLDLFKCPFSMILSPFTFFFPRHSPPSLSHLPIFIYFYYKMCNFPFYPFFAYCSSPFQLSPGSRNSSSTVTHSPRRWKTPSGQWKIWRILRMWDSALPWEPSNIWSVPTVRLDRWDIMIPGALLMESPSSIFVPRGFEPLWLRSLSRRVKKMKKRMEYRWMSLKQVLWMVLHLKWSAECLLISFISSIHMRIIISVFCISVDMAVHSWE